MLDASPKPLGTVPIYETISLLGDIPKMDPKFLIGVIRRQAEQGVDFMTLHAGLLLRHIPNAMKRKMGIVSRGGAIMAEWMMENKAENPLYTHWDEVMDILAEHDVTVSLGDLGPAASPTPLTPRSSASWTSSASSWSAAARAACRRWWKVRGTFPSTRSG